MDVQFPVAAGRVRAAGEPRPRSGTGSTAAGAGATLRFRRNRSDKANNRPAAVVTGEARST